MRMAECKSLVAKWAPWHGLDAIKDNSANREPRWKLVGTKAYAVLVSASRKMESTFESAYGLSACVRVVTSIGFVSREAFNNVSDAKQTLLMKTVEFDGVMSATRIWTHPAYFLGEKFKNHIKKRKVVKITVRVLRTIADAASLSFWLGEGEIRPFKRLSIALERSQKLAWTRFCATPKFFSGISCVANVFSAFDRSRDIVRGKNVFFSTVDVVSWIAEAAVCGMELVPNMTPLSVAITGLVAASTSLLSFFLDPKAK
jgi:hypothetical protein